MFDVDKTPHVNPADFNTQAESHEYIAELSRMEKDA